MVFARIVAAASPDTRPRPGWHADGNGEDEARTGAGDPDWPDWYERYMVGEQAGNVLPT